MDRVTFRLTALAVILSSLLMARPSLADTPPNIHLVGPNGLLRAGDTVSVMVQIDSAGRLINAVDLHLVYDPAFLQVIRIDQSQSVWPLWPEQPQWSNAHGTISLVAGRPHGLIAINAPVATVLFRALGTSLTQVVSDSARSGVYLNDGLGTKVSVTGERLDVQLADPLVLAVPLDPTTTPRPDQWTSTDSIHVRWTPLPNTSYSYNLSTKVEDQPDDVPDASAGRIDYDHQDEGVYFFTIKSRQGNGDWSRVSQYRFLLDQRPPEPFELTPLTASETGGHPAISWSTTDTVSGVVESRLSINGRDAGPVTSPLPLKVAWQGKVLMITVSDAAGNIQTASWRVPGSTTPWSEILIVASAVVIILLLTMLLVHRTSRRRL